MSIQSNVEQDGWAQNREQIRVRRARGTRNRLVDRGALTLWFDTRAIEGAADWESLFARVTSGRFTGVVLHAPGGPSIFERIPQRMLKIVDAPTPQEKEAFGAALRDEAGRPREDVVIASHDLGLLERSKAEGFATCVWAFVDNAQSMHGAVEQGVQHTYLMVRFRDPTNIPLELLIASLQPTQTTLVKEIVSPHDVDDAVVTLGVMEVGADGVAFSPRSHEVLDALFSRLDARGDGSVRLETATVLRSTPIGMGHRSCIDTTTLFADTEGILVGSTSQGGILCCPEVFFLPYMELRPFRVNAGAVHSYVYNFANRTDYMSELRAGSPVMIVDRSGRTRRAAVGRMKTEVRPLRLIEAAFGDERRLNVILQDDWHVRIFSEEAKPLNITELKPGDRVLALPADPGRHVGIKVDEHIVEV
jgi:3-dehydroquinate synthase II/3-amino-4-hydroxybenzoic acid synthase